MTHPVYLSVMQSTLMQYNKQLLQALIFEILMLKFLRSSDLSGFLMRTLISQQICYLDSIFAGERYSSYV